MSFLSRWHNYLVRLNGLFYDEWKTSNERYKGWNIKKVRLKDLMHECTFEHNEIKYETG